MRCVGQANGWYSRHDVSLERSVGEAKEYARVYIESEARVGLEGVSE